MSVFKRWVIPAAVYVILIAGLLALLAYERFLAQGGPVGGLLVSPRDGSPYAITDGFTTADNGGAKGVFDFELRFRHDSPETLVEGTTTYYYDSGCEISLNRYYTYSGRVLVADVYIKDISRLKTSLAGGRFARNAKASPVTMARGANAVLAVTGNNYSEGEIYTELRNGVLYSRTGGSDVCVLGWDGSLNVLSDEEFDVSEAMEAGAYQIWSEGHILIKDGSEYEGADDGYSAVRCAIGCVENGHYVFVLTEGRMTLDTLAKNMLALGCRSAYSLYGGSAADMIFQGEPIGFERMIDRDCADIIYITTD